MVVDDVLTIDKPAVFPVEKERAVLFSALASADILLTLDRADFSRRQHGSHRRVCRSPRAVRNRPKGPCGSRRGDAPRSRSALSVKHPDGGGQRHPHRFHEGLSFHRIGRAISLVGCNELVELTNGLWFQHLGAPSP